MPYSEEAHFGQMTRMPAQRWWDPFISTLEEACIVTHSSDIFQLLQSWVCYIEDIVFSPQVYRVGYWYMYNH